MNAEFVGGDCIGGEAALGAGAGAEGMERSRRSPRPEDDAAGLDGAGEENEEKSPRPLEGLVVWFCACVYDGAALGLESKKLPPPPNMLDVDVVGGDFVLVKLSSPENGDGLGAGCAAWLKDKLLKASFIPPKDDC